MSKVSIGHIREQELYEALVERFGRDSVYINSKYVQADGLEKELWDVMVLSLPYAVVFQIKWRDRTADVFAGDRSKVEIARLEKKINSAAKQFYEFLSLYHNCASVRLPRVWRNNGGNYDLPLEYIRHIIPVVVIDFEDFDYAEPSKRTNLRPEVAELPVCVKSLGIIHCFLFKDLINIVSEMFTVGDLVTYLIKRRQLIESNVKVLNYAELDLFALYQSNYPTWEDLRLEDFAAIESGIFEAKRIKHTAKFQQRQEFYKKCDHIDRLLASIARCALNDIVCLQNIGRLRLMTSVMKKNVSSVITQNLEKFSNPKDGNICSMQTSIGNYDSELMSDSYFCITVCNGDATQMFPIANYSYLRSLRRILSQDKSDVAKEVMLIIISGTTSVSYIEVRQILKDDYKFALTDEEITSTRLHFDECKFKASEWNYMQEKQFAAENHN